MIRKGVTKCPLCYGDLKYYDRVKRLTKKEYGMKNYVNIRRFKCSKCKRIHRELPRYILPYRQYTSDIILDVLNGLISSDMIKYEDFPNEMTMKRWIMFYLKSEFAQDIHFLLWNK